MPGIRTDLPRTSGSDGWTNLRSGLTRLAFAVVLGTLATPWAALAQQPPREPAGPTPRDPTAAERETARSLAATGNGKFKAGDYAGALAAYLAADAIMAVPTTGYLVATAQDKLQRLLEARETALRVARSSASPGEPSQFAAARKGAAKLAADLAQRIPSLRIEVTSSRLPLPDDVPVDLDIDGRRVPGPATRLAHKVDPGAHQITVAAPGFEQQRESVTVAEGQERVVTVTLVRARPSTPEPPVSTVPSGPRPQASSTPPRTPPPARAPPDEPGKLSPLVFVGYGTAGVGLLVGTITGIVALSADQAAQEGCVGTRCPLANKSDAERALMLADVSTASFIVAGAGAAVGTVALVALGSAGTDDSPRSAADGRGFEVRALLGPGTVGIRGTF